MAKSAPFHLISSPIPLHVTGWQSRDRS